MRSKKLADTIDPKYRKTLCVTRRVLRNILDRYEAIRQPNFIEELLSWQHILGMNTKTYYELADATVLGRSAASVFSRLKFWINQSDLVHEGITFCFLTYQRIAEEIGTSVSTARRAIASLIKHGWIEKARLKAKRWNQVNCYAFGPNAPKNEVKNDTKKTTKRTAQNEQLGNINTNSSSKKALKKRKIKEAQAKALEIGKGIKKRAFRSSSHTDPCKACNGSGIVSDEFNNGYRCLCADGRSKSAAIPEVPEELFLTLKAQAGNLKIS